VVSADAVLHTATFGVRTLQGRQPVTLDTHFAVASTTKSMTATMVAEFVDQGVLSWDQPVIDAWSGFRAPTDVLTRYATCWGWPAESATAPRPTSSR
jgi:CubicO group peptidase (beta-lactamase class C family)